MAKFIVPITRDITETTMAVVEADSRLEARDKALDEVQQSPQNFNFTVDDCTGGEPYFPGGSELCDIEEVGELLVEPVGPPPIPPPDDDLGRPCECFNCMWNGGEEELNPIKDFSVRVEPGDTTVPAGECPECGCLAYLKDGPCEHDYDDTPLVEWPLPAPRGDGA